MTAYSSPNDSVASHEYIDIKIDIGFKSRENYNVKIMDG